MDDIEIKVRKVLVEQLGLRDADLKLTDDIVTDLGADSLDAIETVMALEDEFVLEIPDEKYEQVRTVQQAIDLIRELVPN